MSKPTAHLDKGMIEELYSAIEEDKLYWIRNDAKIRAVTKAQSYEEFRDYVAAAHLQPLSKQDVKKRTSSWNTIVGRKSENQE